VLLALGARRAAVNAQWVSRQSIPLSQVRDKHLLNLEKLDEYQRFIALGGDFVQDSHEGLKSRGLLDRLVA
jgi:hypothetical protein